MEFLNQKNNFLVQKKNWIALILIIFLFSIPLFNVFGQSSTNTYTITSRAADGTPTAINGVPVSKVFQPFDPLGSYYQDTNSNVFYLDSSGNPIFYENKNSIINGQGAGNYTSPSVEGELLYQCWPGGYTIRIDWCVADVSYLAMKGAAWLLWAVGSLFNFVITYTVVQMATYTDNTHMPALNIAWTTFRDLANIFFIFILLYIAIATILRLSGFHTKKLLTNLIIIALLINFSLFFTKIIIDASNRLAYEFYKEILPTGQGQSLADCSGLSADCGLSDAFLKPLQLSSIYTPGANGSAGQVNSTAFLTSAVGGNTTAQSTSNVNPNLRDTVWNAGAWQIIRISMFGTFLILVTSFVFLAGCILFAVRFITLIILMLFSALAFMAMVLPQTSKHASKWWNKLFSEALVAPAFFMMIWVVLRMLNGGALIAGPQPTFADFAGGVRGDVSVLLNFALIIGLLISSLIVAKLTGSSGSKLALQTFNGARGKVQGLVGRGATRGLGINALNERLQSGKGFVGRFGNTFVGDSIRRATAGALVGAKFGSKTSVKDVNKRQDEVADRRAKVEARKIAEEHPERLAREMQIRMAVPRQKVQQANKAVEDAQQRFGQAGSTSEKAAAQMQISAANKLREAAVKDLEAARQDAVKAAGGPDAVSAQKARARELESSFMNIGSRRAAAKKLKEAADQGKMYTQMSRERKTERLLERVADGIEKVDKDVKSGNRGSRSEESSSNANNHPIT